MRMATSGTSFRSALGSALGSDCYSAFSSLLQARQTLSSYRSRLMRRPMGLRGTTSTGSCGTLMDFCGSAPKRDSRASTATALPTTRRIRDCLIAGSLTCSKPAAASIGSRTATVYACSTLNPEDRMFTPYRPCVSGRRGSSTSSSKTTMALFGAERTAESSEFENKTRAGCSNSSTCPSRPRPLL